MPSVHRSQKYGITFSSLLVIVAVTAWAQTEPADQAEVSLADSYASSHKTIEVLGRLLFWDPILSGSRDTACATCHHPDFAYTDGRELSRGTGAIGLGPARVDTSNAMIPNVRRNSPTVLNTALNGVSNGGVGGGTGPGLSRQNTGERAPMFWDNRVRSLALQALEPIKEFEEMRGPDYTKEAILAVVVSRLEEIPTYRQLFDEAFGAGSAITSTRLGEAIAAYEKTLIAINSPYDQFLAGNRGAFGAQQQRGLEAFNRVGCGGCHGGLMFSDYDLHTEGVPEHPALDQPDPGAGRFNFRTPTLRNIGLTAPYMHNGTKPTLLDVMQFYNQGQSENPNVANPGESSNDPVMVGLDSTFTTVLSMSDSEMADIVAFMEALTDSNFDRSIPTSVPSGLTPGGSIQDVVVLERN